MKASREINSFRRSLMRALTRNVGTSVIRVKDGEIPEIKTVLISRPNHRLGNLLLLTPLVQEVINTFPDCEIDLFVKGNLAPAIFCNNTNVGRIIQLPKKPFSNLRQYAKGWWALRKCKYDLVINASHDSSSGRLSTSLARGTYKFFGEFDTAAEAHFPDYRHFAKYPVYNLRKFLIQLGVPEKESAVPLLNIDLDLSELEAGCKKLDRLVRNDKMTICLFTDATGEKCYSDVWWQDFLARLQEEFPQYNIIELLPVTNVSRLYFKIPSFYSTDIRAMGALVANTALFITADCCVMHLASAVGTPTVGLFSVTRQKVYRPYSRHSMAIDTSRTEPGERLGMIRDILLNIAFSKSIIN